MIDNIIYKYKTDVKEPTLIKMNCSSCSKPLVELFLTGKGPILELIAECPYCGDKSFVKKIEGIFKFAAAEGLTINYIADEKYITFKLKA